MVNTEELSKIMRESNYDIYTARGRIRDDVDPEGSISKSLKEHYESRDYQEFGLHIPLVSLFPSKLYVPVLVDSLNFTIDNEGIFYALDIVLALSDLAAPEAVSVLARAAAWHVDDESDTNDLALNSIGALLHIDTPESRSAVLSFVDDDRDLVRRLAEEIRDDPERFWG